MTRDLRPFGQALAGWMRKKGLSTKRLAELAGYKSKTSIVRILREECVQSGRERLFARISELGLLSAAERRTLLQALELSRVGGEQAAARLRLRQLLMGRRDETPADTSLQRALDSLRTAHAARILLLNGCRLDVIDALRDVLARRAAHTMEHYVTVGASVRRDMNALCAILSIACVPSYACWLREARADEEKGAPTRQDALCFTAQDRDGVSTDTLILFPAEGGVAVHTQPSSCGLFDFFRSAILRGGIRPSVSASSVPKEEPGTIVDAMRFCTEVERGRAARAIKPDVCLNQIPGEILRAALVDGGVLRHFPGWSERQISAKMEEFFYYHNQRFHNAFDGEQPRSQIMSARSLRHFALTGRFDSNFSAIRPFTVRERIAILENFTRRMREDDGALLRVWNAEADLAMEVHCYDGLGIIAFPAREAGGINISFQTAILRDAHLVSLFQSCFDDDLLRNCAMSREESLHYINGLLGELRATP